MTGEEHYREAEELAEGSSRAYGPTAEEIALAQVHATLALAAATHHACQEVDHRQYGGYSR